MEGGGLEALAWPFRALVLSMTKRDNTAKEEDVWCEGREQTCTKEVHH
jgi:hypothetical protein